MQEKGAIGDNMNLGSTFRKLRQEKGISISSLSGENISKSQISRFERGETDISFQKLFYLLESISISMEEFLSLSHNNQCPNFNNFIQQLEEVFFSNNITYLNQLLNTEYHYYQETSYTYHLLNCIMIKNMLLKSTGKDESTKCEKLFLTNYLFSVESFGYYELIILSHTEHILDVTLLYRYINEIIAKSNNININSEKQSLILQLLLNVIQLCIEKNDFRMAKTYLVEAHTLLSSNSYYNEKIVFHFLKGYLEYYKNPDEGKALMKKSLELFHFFDKRLYDYYFVQYMKITNR